MTEWAALRHAYGTAEDVPGLLAAAEESGADFGPSWDEVWSRLCHQGTTYTASYAALPALTAIAERHAPAGYVAALDLASGIIASTDGPRDSAEVRTEWAAALDRLHELAQRNLPLAADDSEFIYGLQTLLAFEDGGVWQRRLNHVADGELPLGCPHCDAFLLLNLEGPEHLLTDYSDASVAPTPVHPAEPSADSIEGRILATTRSLGRTELAATLTYVFSTFVCPRCGTPFQAVDAFA
jgi:hypothetical protein